ncbi:hypothetical protein G9H65_07410 [Cytophagaceae bacterium 50A-KIRBA]|uniref:hypothetical protein n=2 Tax=Aquirufa ecclesiirivi TaxID=2715124 RepID=UPI00140992BA|nr:hypothetical protein [Aquirufa ecclesiirivi]NHC49160.1 hypothetical protein [Aquirufa ecclesiirivi]
MIKTRFALLILLFLDYYLYFLTNKYILTDEIYKGYLLNQYSENTVLQILEKINWIKSYIDFLVPFLLLLKIFCVLMIIQIGLFLYDIKVGIKQVLRAIIWSEYVFLISPIITLFWFLIFNRNYGINDVKYFPPFSLLEVFQPEMLEEGIIYILQSINLFEIAYVIILSKKISQACKLDFDEGLKIISSSYIPFFLLWLVIVAFMLLIIA